MKISHLKASDLLIYEDMALDLAREMAARGLEFFQGGLTGEAKADGSSVSEADKALERLARKILGQKTPSLGFVGEEFDRLSRLSLDPMHQRNPLSPSNTAEHPGLKPFEHDLNEPVDEILNLNEDTYWIVDPIDGTSNFLSNSPLWTHLIALVEKGEPVVGVVAIPALGEVFVASRGSGARFGRLANDKSTYRPCFTKPTISLDAAHLSVSSPMYFSKRGIESWYIELLNRKGELRTHSDAYGYTRILCGGIDGQIDPVAFQHDIAALQILFDETPGAFFTSLQGDTGKSRFQKGSMVAAGTQQLGHAILNSFRQHLMEHRMDSIKSHPGMAFCEEWILDHHIRPFERDGSETRRWARAMETAVAIFCEANPGVHVEDVSCIASSTESMRARVKNGKVDSPPRVKETAGMAIRAVVNGGTGLLTVTLPLEDTRINSVGRALQLALQQSTALKEARNGAETLAYHDNVQGHLGVCAWGTRISLDGFHQMIEAIAKNQAKRTSSEIHTIETMISMRCENRLQIFLDGAQHTITQFESSVGNSVTAARGDEKRRAFGRMQENRPVGLVELDEMHQKILLTTQKQAEQLLDAELVPEDVDYDWLAVDADLLGLILHEAIGHASEGDLIATGQSAFGADGKMLALDIGPPWLNIVIDGNLNNCGVSTIDSEGTLARRKMIVRGGKLVDAIHSRETALAAGKVPDGCARVESIFHPSLNRMTSIWVQAEKSSPLPPHFNQEDPSSISAQTLHEALEKSHYLDGSKGVLFLSGWKGGTATCSNLEFRADVARIWLLKRGEAPKLMRDANFTGIATECFRSAEAAFGPLLCRSIGMCGKDGQSVPTSDGGPAVMLMSKNPKVKVIGTGEGEAE